MKKIQDRRLAEPLRPHARHDTDGACDAAQDLDRLWHRLSKFGSSKRGEGQLGLGPAARIDTPFSSAFNVRPPLLLGPLAPPRRISRKVWQDSSCAGPASPFRATVIQNPVFLSSDSRGYAGRYSCPRSPCRCSCGGCADRCSCPRSPCRCSCGDDHLAGRCSTPAPSPCSARGANCSGRCDILQRT